MSATEIRYAGEKCVDNCVHPVNKRFLLNKKTTEKPRISP
ncbi:hypothetical protein [Morganella morganii IS15]|nr:hypothetical protein [Morganella morganii IS15]